MAVLNRFEMIGRLTRDPEVKESASGTNRTELNMAQTKSWKNAAGEKQEKSLFFKFVAYGKAGEVLAQYTKKGSKLFIAATLEPYKSEKEDGTTVYGISFIVQEFEFLESKKQEGATARDAEEAFGIEPQEIKIEDIPY